MTKSIVMGVEVNLPDPVQKIAAAPLMGSDKQVQWAQTIRRDIYNDLVYQITSRPHSLGVDYTNALLSVDGMINYIQNNRLIAMGGDDDLRAIKIAEIAQSFADTADKFNRLADVMSHTDAKYWIDNRTNQSPNVNNNKLRAYVMGTK